MGNERALRRAPDNRTTSIYESAAAVFIEHGYVGATTRLLSEAAGVAESTLFRIVHDKASLYRDLFDYCWSEINALVAGMAFEADVRDQKAATDPAEILVADLQALAGSFDDERMRRLVTFAFQAMHRRVVGFEPDASTSYARFRRRLQSYATLAIARGGVPHDGPAALVDTLIARLRGAWMAWYHTAESVQGRRPTYAELSAQLSGELRADRTGGASRADMANSRQAS